MGGMFIVLYMLGFINDFDDIYVMWYYFLTLLPYLVMQF